MLFLPPPKYGISALEVIGSVGLMRGMNSIELSVIGTQSLHWAVWEATGDLLSSTHPLLSHLNLTNTYIL